MEPTKTCPKCGEAKPLSEFHKNKSRPDGLTYWCKECRRESQDRSRLRQAVRNSVPGTPMMHKTCNQCGKLKPLRMFNRNRGRRDGYEYYCKQCAAELSRKSRQNNYRPQPNTHAERAEYKRQWYQRNKDKSRAAARRRLARKRNAPGDHTAEDIQRIGDRQGWRCWYCQVDCRDNYHVEHRVPLSRGGSNDPSNIVISCPTCNLSKRDKLPHEWCDRLI